MFFFFPLWVSGLYDYHYKLFHFTSLHLPITERYISLACM